MNYQLVTLGDRKDLIEQVARLDNQSWPTFLQHSDVKSWSKLYSVFSDTVLILLQDQKVITVGFTVPVFWDQSIEGLPVSIEDVLLKGIAGKQALTEVSLPNTLVPIGALVDSSVQGQGLSRLVLCEMKNLAKRLGLNRLVVPVRPTQKSRYPLQSIEEYVAWRNENGQYFDPWLRVHQKLGAEIIHIAPTTLNVTGTRADWASWTGMRFEQTGLYVVGGALSAVKVDAEVDSVSYGEPNVWMSHPMS